MSKLDPFTQQYIETAFWSSTFDDGGRDDRPMDEAYSAADLDPASLASMAEDCRRFQRINARRIARGEDSQAGHDFWLTRNGHGAGFWDGDWPEPYASRLTDSAHSFGPSDLIVGDDGKVYAYPIRKI